jgi:hypothetical protein
LAEAPALPEENHEPFEKGDAGGTLEIFRMEPDTHRLLKGSNGRAGGYYGLIASCLLESEFLPAAAERAGWPLRWPTTSREQDQRAADKRVKKIYIRSVIPSGHAIYLIIFQLFTTIPIWHKSCSVCFYECTFL